MIPRLPSTPSVAPLAEAFAAELVLRGFGGDIDLSQGGRSVLSTDNSIYELRPQAVLFPAGADDLVRIAKLVADDRFRDLKLTPRGGGTGTNGQSLTDGVMIDLSRHMNRILEINGAEGWVRVEAGVVKDQLNQALEAHGLFFAPELSTSNRATIGGMISTDACGQGSCLYGKTRDHVLELGTVLLDGTLWHSAPMSDEELARVQARRDRVGEIHRVVDRVHRDNRTMIAERFPKLNRCLTGYDLAHLRTADDRFDLNAVLCGSEGTLGLLAEAKLRVLPVPRCAAIVAVRYSDFDAALRDAGVMLALKAASVETIDSLVLGLGRGDPSWADVRDYFPDDADGPAQGINLVEFVSQDADDLERRLARVEEVLCQPRPGRRGFTVARGHAAADKIWAMRKKAAGLLGNVRGDRRPVPFVEDTAVPPERLADFVAEFRALLDRRGLSYGMFGHVDAGVLHVRPALDLKDAAQETLIREITDEVAALTERYGGLLWGEHGKGLRSEYALKVFGPLYPALQAVKTAFDPHGQLNPGKVASPDDTALLRIDAVPFRGQLDRVMPATTRQAFDEGLHCNGNGACYNFDPDDVMCPSWKSTRDRRHSPKGRAVLLREWLRRLSVRGVMAPEETRRLRAGIGAWANLPKRSWNTVLRAFGRADFSDEVKDAMDGCLACKGCVGQCPVKVDVPGIKAKFLELYYGRYLRPPKDWAVLRLERMLPLAARAPGLYNAVVASRIGEGVARLAGFVDVPQLTGIRLEDAARARGVEIATPSRLESLDEAERTRSVVLVQDAFTTYFDTALVLDFLSLVERLGFRPWLAPFRPNGKPLHVTGQLRRFEAAAGRNAAMLDALSASGVPLVGLDPSMTLAYRSEYRGALGEQGCPPVLLPQEWLASALSGREPYASPRRAFRLLPHCTERSCATEATRAWVGVFERFGARLTIVSAGCCGMAGLYGHETAHRDNARAIYAQSWAKRVEGMAPQEPLLATGYSCRSQVKLVEGIPLLHPVQALLELMAGAEPGTAPAPDAHPQLQAA